MTKLNESSELYVRFKSRKKGCDDSRYHSNSPFHTILTPKKNVCNHTMSIEDLVEK